MPEQQSVSGSDQRVLRSLSALPGHWLSGYEPAELPDVVRRFIRRGDRRSLQTLLVEIVFALERRS